MPGERMQRKGQKRDRPFAGRDGDPSSAVKAAGYCVLQRRVFYQAYPMTPEAGHVPLPGFRWIDPQRACNGHQPAR